MEKAKKEDKQNSKVNEVIEKVEASEDFLSGYLNNWTLWYKLYRSYIDDNKWPTKTKIFNPYVFSAIETHTSKSISSKPDGEFRPEEKDAEGDPEKIGQAFDYWWRKDKATFKGQAAFKKSLMYGSGMARTLWKFRTGVVSGKKKIIEDRPTVRINRLEDGMCGFDPEADSWDEVRFAWDKCYVTKREMEDWLKGPEKDTFDAKEIKKAIEALEKSGDTDGNTYRTEKLKTLNGKLTDNKIKKAECIYLEDYESGYVYNVIARKFLVRKALNPQPFERSFIFYIDTIVPSEVLGMGEIEPVERLQHGLNLVQNQRRDNIASILKNQWIVGDRADIDEDELVDELNGIIHASDIDQIKALFKPNVTQNAFQEELSIKQDIQSALAITDASKGNTGDLDAAKSGRALALLQSAADARVQSKLQLFEIMFIKEVAEKWQRLASVYQKDDLVISEGGRDIKITPEEFKGEWSYYVESGSTTHTDKTQEKDEFLAYMDKLIGLAKMKAEQGGVNPKTGEALPAPALNYDKMAEKLSEKFNVKDWRELWPQEQKPQEEPQEALPGVDIEERPRDFGQGEMLPEVGELPPAKKPEINQQQEMLPKIDE